MFEQDDIADELKVRLLEMQKILNRLKSHNQNPVADIADRERPVFEGGYYPGRRLCCRTFMKRSPSACRIGTLAWPFW
jgi:hypothetical protein